MLQIAICENVPEGAPDSGLAGMVRRRLDASGVEAQPLFCAQTPLDMLERIVNPGQQPLVDLLLADADLPGLTGLQLIREAKNAGYAFEAVLVSDSPELAYQASVLGVRGFVLKPLDEALFDRMLDQMLPELEARCAKTATLRFRDCIRRVRAIDVVYVETSGHDQVVHLFDGTEHSLRSSSTALFDQLPPAGRFFKNGSSYIINLDHVRVLSNDGYVTLSDGSNVTVPVRVRKQFEEALFNAAS